MIVVCRTLRKLVRVDDNDKNDANYDGELLEDDEDDDDNSLVLSVRTMCQQ